MPKKPKHKPNKNKGYIGLNLYDLGATWDTSRKDTRPDYKTSITRLERAEARRKRRALARRLTSSKKDNDSQTTD